MKCSLLSSLLLFCIGSMFGCTSRPTVLNAQTPDDVGRVFVSVSSAAPLEDYFRSLPPEFDLAPADALDIAVPVSQSSLFRAVEALRGGIAINRSTVAAPTGAAAPVPVSGGDGTLPALSLGGFPADRQIGIDPVLRYQAATRLMSEVKMLNRALRNAPFDPATEQAHLVQFNVTVMPHHDAAPYDAYVDLTVAQSTAGVRLVPALLNDSAELTQQQWAKNSVRAFNVATTSAFGSIAAALGLNYANNQLEEVAGYSLNGITNVGRAGDRALRIRLAAQNQGRAGERFLTARTHNVFVVVISKLESKTSPELRTASFCTRFEFRRVNGGTIPHQQPSCDGATDLVVQLPADEQPKFSIPTLTNAMIGSPDTALSAFMHNKKKPEELKVIVPAWDAYYLGELRATMRDCNGTLQSGTLASAKFGKSIEVLFAFPTAECDVAGASPLHKPVTLIIERMQVRSSAKIVFNALVNIPMWDRKPAQEKTETPKIASCATTGTFVRSEHVVVDHTGKGVFQALVRLDKGEKNAQTGVQPQITSYLAVEGADAVSAVSSDASATPIVRSRIALNSSTRYIITLQNAVPNKPVAISFATLEGKEFTESNRCTVLPVLLLPLKPSHGT